MTGFGIAQPVVTLNEAQAFVRMETGEEEAILAGLIRTASALCESFLGQVVLAREFVENLPAGREWQRLAIAPVRAITGVQGIGEDGAPVNLASTDYAIDVDSSGAGWVKLTGPASLRRLTVSGMAGLASDRNDVPEPIRQGVIRLVSHLFTARDRAGDSPPAAVTALWRPYRRVRLG